MNRYESHKLATQPWPHPIHPSELTQACAAARRHIQCCLITPDPVARCATGGLPIFAAAAYVPAPIPVVPRVDPAVALQVAEERRCLRILMRSFLGREAGRAYPRGKSAQIAWRVRRPGYLINTNRHSVAGQCRGKRYPVDPCRTVGDALLGWRRYLAAERVLFRELATQKRDKNGRFAARQDG